jgi:hypothetical protein
MLLIGRTTEGFMKFCVCDLIEVLSRCLLEEPGKPRKIVGVPSDRAEIITGNCPNTSLQPYAARPHSGQNYIRMGFMNL